MGVSYLYVAEEHRDGVPLEENWIARAGSEDFARLVDYRDEYQPGARRYDVGQRTQFELLPMAIAALEQLHDWRVDRIAEALAGITGTIADAGGRPRTATRSLSTGEGRTCSGCGSRSRSDRRSSPASPPPIASPRCAARHCASLPTST